MKPPKPTKRDQKRNEAAIDAAVIAIGERIRSVRKAKGITQVQLAPKIGNKQSHLSAIERGEAGVGSRLVRIAMALKVDPKELLP